MSGMKYVSKKPKKQNKTHCIPCVSRKTYGKPSKEANIVTPFLYLKFVN